MSICIKTKQFVSRFQCDTNFESTTDTQQWINQYKPTYLHKTDIENNTWARVDMEFLCECLSRQLTSEMSS